MKKLMLVVVLMFLCSSCSKNFWDTLDADAFQQQMDMIHYVEQAW